MRFFNSGCSKHLFSFAPRILQEHYPEYRLVVPSLPGYELAREIRRFVGAPDLEGLSFQRILEDTERHYRERGGMDKMRAELGPGRELSIYLQEEEGEEEVLWMRVGIGLQDSRRYSCAAPLV